MSLRNPDPRQKPPLGSYIDWSHPLADGLVGCWLFNEQSGKIIDLVDNSLASHQTASWEFNNLRFNNSNNEYSSFLHKQRYHIEDQATLICQYQFLENVSGTPFVLQSTGNGYRPAFGLIKLYDNNPINLTIRQQDGTNIDSVLDLGQPTLQVQYHIAVWKSGEFAKGYSEGKLYDTNTSNVPSAPLDIDSSCRISFGGLAASDDLPNNRFLNGRIFYGSLYNKVLNDEQIEQLYYEPYIFIIWPQTLTYFDISAGSSIPSGSAAITDTGIIVEDGYKDFIINTQVGNKSVIVNKSIKFISNHTLLSSISNINVSNIKIISESINNVGIGLIFSDGYKLSQGKSPAPLGCKGFIDSLSGRIAIINSTITNSSNIKNQIGIKSINQNINISNNTLINSFIIKQIKQYSSIINYNFLDSNGYKNVIRTTNILGVAQIDDVGSKLISNSTSIIDRAIINILGYKDIIYVGDVSLVGKSSNEQKGYKVLKGNAYLISNGNVIVIGYDPADAITGVINIDINLLHVNTVITKL